MNLKNELNAYMEEAEDHHDIHDPCRQWGLVGEQHSQEDRHN